VDGITSINVPLSEDEHERLDDVKGDRTWREAILEEFEVKDG
jgi:hypothetical protein